MVAANVAMKEDNVDLQDFTTTVANTEQGTPNTGTREQTEEPVQLLPDQEQQDEEVEDEEEEEEEVRRRRRGGGDCWSCRRLHD